MMMNMNNVSVAQDLSGLADPTVGPVLAAVANPASTLDIATFWIAYSWSNENGETKVSPRTTITLSALSNIQVTVPALPAGATKTNIYMTRSKMREELLLQGTTTTTTYTQSTNLAKGAGPQPVNQTHKWVLFTQVVGNNPIGHETLAVNNAAAVNFVSVPAVATRAYITVETAQIRYWMDGSNPTTTVGHLASAGDILRFDSYLQIANFKAIAVTATAATLQVTYS